jgi:hypothetical protein
MSRGPGRFQRRIIDSVSEARTVCLSRLRWDLAGEAAPPSSSISEAFNSGYHRAVRRLVEDGYIETRKRYVTDIDELIKLYPYKTRRAEIRAMRAQLLPVVKAYLAFRQARKFTRAQTEKHFYESLPDEARAEAERRWLELEGPLFAAMASGGDALRDAVFDVIARGRQLFRRRAVGHGAPLLRLIDRAVAAGATTPPPVLADLATLASSVFPTAQLQRRWFKVDLYEIAHLGRNFSQHVKDQFIEYAMREAPAVMRALPGFRAAWSQKVGKLAIPHKDEHSPLIHKLLQRDALAPFEFLSLRQDSGQQPADPRIAA